MEGLEARNRAASQKAAADPPHGGRKQFCLPVTKDAFHKTNRLPFFKKMFPGFLLILDIESLNPVESWLEVMSALWSMFY